VHISGFNSLFKVQKSNQPAVALRQANDIVATLMFLRSSAYLVCGARTLMSVTAVPFWSRTK